MAIYTIYTEMYVMTDLYTQHFMYYYNTYSDYFIHVLADLFYFKQLKLYLTTCTLLSYESIKLQINFLYITY